MSEPSEQPPRCPKCGYVMCQEFDSRPINAVTEIATPNGKYTCYHCSPSQSIEYARVHAPAEQGWLLEKIHNGQIWYVTVDDLLTWTDDPLKALRLARRADAELLSTLIDDCEKIASHEWVTPSDKEKEDG